MAETAQPALIRIRIRAYPVVRADPRRCSAIESSSAASGERATQSPISAAAASSGPAGTVRSRTTAAAAAHATTSARSALQPRSASCAQTGAAMKPASPAADVTTPIVAALNPRSSKKIGRNGTNDASATPTRMYARFTRRISGFKARKLSSRRTPPALTMPHMGADIGTPRPQAESLDTQDWTRSRRMRRMRAALQSGFLFPALSSFCRLTVNDRHRVQSLQGSAVFVSNHVSALDAVVMAEALPPRHRHRSVVVAAADSIFKRKWEARLAQVTVDAFPIPRSGGARPHLEYLKDLLRQNWSVIIFPEG